MVSKYISLYTSDSPKWENITELATGLGWLDLIENSGADYFVKNGVSKQYVFELIEGATRVNYGQVCMLFSCLNAWLKLDCRISTRSTLSRQHVPLLLMALLKSKAVTGRSLNASLIILVPLSIRTLKCVSIVSTILMY